MYKKLVRPFLFTFDSEDIHKLTVSALVKTAYLPLLQRFAYAGTAVLDPALHVSLLGQTFINPVGLAAGFDKQAGAMSGLGMLGFSHLEVGTLTRLPQPGNPRPRTFRLIPDDALINRMGFPNPGVDKLNLDALILARKSFPDLKIGFNIGKGKNTPIADAQGDYDYLLRAVLPLADYVCINVSSPNTAGLRKLQAREALGNLIIPLIQLRDELLQDQTHVPVLLKIAPDT